MDDRPESQLSTPKDLFGARELLQLVAKKISSQILLFSLVVLVVLVISGTLYSDNFLVIAAILFVFMMATIGYLFAEQKRKLDRGDETVVGEFSWTKARSSPQSRRRVWRAGMDGSSRLRSSWQPRH